MIHASVVHAERIDEPDCLWPRLRLLGSQRESPGSALDVSCMALQRGSDTFAPPRIAGRALRLDRAIELFERCPSTEIRKRFEHNVAPRHAFESVLHPFRGFND